MTNEEFVEGIKKVSGELWTVFKKSAVSYDPKDDKFWENLIENSNKCIIKYKDTIFERYATKYALTLIDAFEERCKKEKES